MSLWRCYVITKIMQTFLNKVSLEYTLIFQVYSLCPRVDFIIRLEARKGFNGRRSIEIHHFPSGQPFLKSVGVYRVHKLRLLKRKTKVFQKSKMNFRSMKICISKIWSTELFASWRFYIRRPFLFFRLWRKHKLSLEMSTKPGMQ